MTLSLTTGRRHTGAVERLAALIPPAGKEYAHSVASTAFCTELATVLPVITRMAVATKGCDADKAAVAFLAAFVTFCDSKQMPAVVHRDPATDSSLPTLTTRLISLCAGAPEAALLSNCTTVLCGIVHRLPDLARDLMLGLLGNVTSAENEAQACVLTRVLHTCLRPPAADVDTPVASGPPSFLPSSAAPHTRAHATEASTKHATCRYATAGSGRPRWSGEAGQGSG